ncbi:MAG TPA: hypothetical protein VGD37_24930, partial [Kofleriaceae bacterium]
SQLRFAAGTTDVVTSGNDGRLVRWPPGGEPILLAQARQPIDGFAMTRDPASIVFSTADGALWRTGARGEALSFRSGGAHVSRLRAVPGQATVYAGYATGDVVAIDTRSWQSQTTLHGIGAVRDIATTPDGRTIAVATNDGTIHVGTYRDGRTDPDGLRWVTLALRTRDITLAPDGLLVASCTDGTIWLYSPPRGRWLCLPTGTADLGRTAVTDDGKAAVALDFEGALIWIDLEAARAQLEINATTQ